MRTAKIFWFWIAFSLLMWNCKAYRPIEKKTIPSNPELSKKENIALQLAHLVEGDRISIDLENEVSHDLIYLAVDGDSLTAKLQKSKTSFPMKISLNRIQSVQVERVDTAMTLIFSTLGAGLAFAIIYYSLNSLTVF